MDLAKQEEKILKFWKEIRAFEKSVENRSRLPRGKSRGSFVFYEGPPTANGKPGIHHILTRAYKDIICRYKTMQGYRVERKAGWDTHGLPVEIEVEKELGLKNKKDIEKYGIAKFNEKCRQSVWKYKQEWDSLTERIAFWLDLEDPYITYDPLYMEALWGIVKKAHEKGLLQEGYRVAPYCPRCGTSVSSHEVALGYKDVTEDSVFVKFEIKNPISYKLQAKSYLLAWTTTPWTLPGNVALAVGGKIDYILVKQGEEYYILAKERLSILSAQGGPVSSGEGEYKIIKEFKGKELEGLEYKPLFDSLKDAKEKKHYVALADFVTTEDGTGVVHTAVMYGEDDYNLGLTLGLPKIHTVDEAGKFNKRVSQWQGEFVKDIEPNIVEDLRARNLLYKKEAYTHSYPHCWRCNTPLLYYAMQSWFIKMSSLRGKLIENNKAVNWVPAHVKEGRFGEWLRDVKDWNFSRNRYWGTPLPIWKCNSCDNYEVIGSRKDLAKQDFSSNTFYILRHGESDKNVNHIISSKFPESKKFGLTKKGRAQAAKIAKDLKNKKIDYIFSSDFTRTKETAEIVAKSIGVKVQYDKHLREYDLGIYDGMSDRDFTYDFPDIKERFEKKPRGGETTADVQQRMFSFASSINKKYKNKNILIISHGDNIWVLESRLLGLTIDEAVKRKKVNYPEVGQLRNIVFKGFPYNKKGEIDLHRPYVDDISFGCNKCKDGQMKRVESLSDVWFDSGSMPFAQDYGKAKLFPADYICEAIDQTRGWFYTLLAVSTILGLKAPYKNVISLAHVLDKKGEKMSKSKGNVVDPWQMIEKYGSDSLRWYFYTVNHPGDYKRFDEGELQKTYRKFISTFWNTLVFYKTYSADKSTRYPSAPQAKRGGRGKLPSISCLDKWILSRLNNLMAGTAKKLDNYDVTGAARSIDAFLIDDLSNWYVRRSRKRFQNPDTPQEKMGAERVLRYVLHELSRLCAPFTPFLSEEIFQELKAKSYKLKVNSVHWEDFPESDKKFIDVNLEKEMIQAREIVEMVHKSRAMMGRGVRQPLAELRINVKLSAEILQIIKDEVNVKKIKYYEPPAKKWEFAKGDDWSLVVSGANTTAVSQIITKPLMDEGFTNEFIRHVQNMRRAGGFVPEDKIRIRYSADSGFSRIIEQKREQIQKQNNANIMSGGDKKEVFKAQVEFEWEGKKVWIGIKKV